MPGINDGLFAGRAGVASHGAAISALADNISNSNTVGYKAQRANFTDLLSQSLGGGSGAVQIGSGSQLGSVTQIFSQGTFEFTGRGLDLAVDGNGFFVVQDVGGSGERAYSRAGNFTVDKDGNLLNQNGFRVLGFPTGGAGGLDSLNVNQISQNSIDTGNVAMSGNLDASAPIVAIPGGTPTFADLNSAARYSTFVDVYDSLGAAHTATIYFFKTGANAWTVQGYVDGGEVTAGTPGIPTLIGSAALGFSANGSRTTNPASDFTATPVWSNGALPASIDFSFRPFTQFSSQSNVSSISQDGTGGGSVASFNVERDGTLFAKLDNGQSASVGKIALAVFSNSEGLSRRGGTLYAESSGSGVPVVGSPGTGVFGPLTAGALELSTSDIATDFVKLISYQRGFQGSSRIISSINTLLDEIINLIR